MALIVIKTSSALAWTEANLIFSVPQWTVIWSENWSGLITQTTFLLAVTWISGFWEGKGYFRISKSQFLTVELWSTYSFFCSSVPKTYWGEGDEEEEKEEVEKLEEEVAEEQEEEKEEEEEGEEEKDNDNVNEYNFVSFLVGPSSNPKLLGS